MRDGQKTKLKKLKGTRLPSLAKSKILGKSPQADTVELVLHLRHREAIPSLDEFHQSMPHERAYLTPEQFEDAHGMHEDDLATVEAYAKQTGLTLAANHVAACTLELTGTVKQCNDAFAIKLQQRIDATGTHRGYEGEISLPVELDEIVLGITGLDDRRHIDRIRPIPFEEETDDSNPFVVARFFPAEVARLYNFPTEYDGTGETIGLLAFGGGYNIDDINSYCDLQSIPRPTVIAVPPDRNKPDDTPLSMEITADIEVAATVAPGAKIVVYFHECIEESMGQHFLSELKVAIFDKVHRPSIISISFGYVEGKIKPNDMLMFKETCRAASAMGITICVASGDGGSPTREFADFTTPGARVNFPANCPFVLACGGTGFIVEQDKIVKETVWNRLNQTMAATGGGVSECEHYPLPSYQAALDPVENVNPGIDFKGRVVPDIAGSAAQLSSYKWMFQGKLIPGAGTSFVAPLMAGLIARINQGLGYRCGFINPILYELAGTDAFVNITEGSNGAYLARAGFDACSGLGRTEPKFSPLSRPDKMPASSPQTNKPTDIRPTNEIQMNNRTTNSRRKTKPRSSINPLTRPPTAPYRRCRS